MPGKFAAIFRGPPASGKTTVAKEILVRLGRSGEEPLVLDGGWGLDPSPEFRYDPATRYRDLREAAVEGQEFVVIELGRGEPPPILANQSILLDARPGATRNPREWVSILKGQGRTIRSFLIRANVEEAKRRRPTDDVLDMELSHWLYDRADFGEGFSVRAGVHEEMIDTSTISVADAASLVEARLRVYGFPFP